MRFYGPKAGTYGSMAPMRRINPAGIGQYALFGLMSTLWGSNFLFTSFALKSFDPLLIVSARMVLASLTLGIALAIRGTPLPREPGPYKHFALLGLLNIALPYSLITVAQLYVNSSSSVVLSSTTPIFVFIISCFVMKTEKFTLAKGIGLALSFIGILALKASQDTAGGKAGIWPLAIVFCSVLYASGNVYSKRFVSKIDPMVVAFMQIAFGAICLLPVTFLSGQFRVGQPGFLSILSILELGIPGSAVTYLLFFHFIRAWGSTPTSLNTYLQPAVGLFLGVFVQKESMSASAWMSLGLILGGIAIFGAGTFLAYRRKGAECNRATSGEI